MALIIAVLRDLLLNGDCELRDAMGKPTSYFYASEDIKNRKKDKKRKMSSFSLPLVSRTYETSPPAVC